MSDCTSQHDLRDLLSLISLTSKPKSAEEVHLVSTASPCCWSWCAAAEGLLPPIWIRLLRLPPAPSIYEFPKIRFPDRVLLECHVAKRTGV